jgi:hypothetical protein
MCARRLWTQIHTGQFPHWPKCNHFQGFKGYNFSKTLLKLIFHSFSSLYTYIYPKDPIVKKINYSSDYVSSGTGRMGILVIVTMTILEWIWIIIYHTSNSILESFFFFSCLFVSCCLSYTLSMFFFFLVCLYLVMNFSNELDIHQYFV